MADDSSYRLPTTTALTAFDCAARHGSFAGAAKELGTSQPAVSRHIANIEQQLGVRLFERSRTGVRLTEEGRRFYERAGPGLGMIKAATSEAIQPSAPEQVMIACSGSASHYLLMRRFSTLREQLGKETQVGIAKLDNYTRKLPVDPVADVVLDWEKYIRSEDRTVLFQEAVRPVCSPEYAAGHPDALNRPVRGWSDLMFLEPGLPNDGWASWEDWFQAAGRPERQPQITSFDDYIYSLEAAVAGEGIALGWRNFVDQHLKTGGLIALGEDYVERDNRFCGALSEQGRLRPVAHKCLTLLQRLFSSAKG